MTDYPEIYLEPGINTADRQWCQEDVWVGDNPPATKYIRADLCLGYWPDMTHGEKWL